MSKIKIDKENYLLCPTCKGSYLYSQAAACIDNIDDCVGSDSKVTLISGGNITKPDSDVKLPFKGESIAIKFLCRECNKNNNEKYLYISQHEGHTVLTWEKEFPII